MRRDALVSMVWVLVGAVALCFCPAACQKEPGKPGADAEGGKFTVEETSCGKVSEDLIMFEASPDCKHAVCVNKAGGKYVVVVDGVAHTPYDSVLSEIVFSPDAKRVAYVAWHGVRRMAVIDGKEGKEYDSINDASLAFSPDSRRYAYAADDGEKRIVVTDGAEGKGYDKILMGPVFSGNSKNVAYVARCAEKKVCVIDGVEGKEYETIEWAVVRQNIDIHRYPEPYPDSRVTDSPFFGPEGSRTAYIASNGDKWFLVVDGREIMELDSNTELILSPDRKRFACVVSRAEKQRVVLDGTPGREYEQVDQPFFSPDSKHLAFLGGRDNHTYVVLDGQEFKEYYMNTRVFLLVFTGPHTLVGWLDGEGELFRILVSIKE